MFPRFLGHGSGIFVCRYDLLLTVAKEERYLILLFWHTNIYKAPPPQSKSDFTVALASDLQDHVRRLDPHCTGNQLLPSCKTNR